MAYNTNDSVDNGPNRAEWISMQTIMGGVLFVLVILVITLVYQSFTTSQATFQDLKDQVTRQNEKIDRLTQEIRDQDTDIRYISGGLQKNYIIPRD